MDFQAGDIAACYGTGWAPRLISLGTASLFAPERLRIGPSHVAMLVPWRDTVRWFESTTLCPRRCEYRGRAVSGVQLHGAYGRLADYQRGGGRVDVYRLSPLDSLSSAEEQLLARIAKHFLDSSAPYDLGGALVSGTRCLKWTRLLPAAGLESVFCSQLLAAVLMRLGRLNREHPTRFNPASLLRVLVSQGTYQHVRTFDGEPWLRLYQGAEA